MREASFAASVLANLTRRRAAALVLAVAARLASAQCPEPHYRWSEKTTESLLGQTATTASIHAILTTWPIPAIFGAADKCTERAGRELKVYSVTGWVRRRIVEDNGGDLDWHIELTSTKTATVTNNCVVAEIPDPQYGAQYQIARDQFDNLISAAGVTIHSNGDLSTPIHVKVVGAAFFDGEHRGAQGTNNPPHQHGRCNSTSRALWEVHPVYAVFKVGG